ncbi:ABC transporter substrate-binding protein [Clostridium felsineum]|uniref:Sn-glycerol-3-phosphate-binding periplasmic protein UgpB n=1 Tax=Clostridium felsineum TaxID=36839 RepID=A0A1S8L9N8_9CLOT|nr:ABC transporter substrate-binding protein [Clostridium felsineum]MCR3759570.1 ABC transporter substrate-binding protein [Clostridium felsineum]URZ05018.1 sn-glycerol-3-phosphate-binding periplasmic protein UgpB [Clostridium felsineum]URZ10059.1 sn-glycerol-3-phosphate-binding periplasmic protein UgpB [Clostridium felsineum]
MKRKVLSLLLVGVISVTALVGCSKGEASGVKSKTVEITFWHAMSGKNGEALNKLVDDFNNSHSDIKVKAEFQGKYDDELNKLKSAEKGNEAPDIVQVYDIGTRFMIDSKWAEPMQTFIDKDKYDTSSLEPNLLSYYTVNNKLYSMPFNSSTPILYYNKTAFKEADLDPNKPPKNFSELEKYAKALTKKDSSGNVTRYGFSMAIYGWLFEQYLVKQGRNYANNGNGREGVATKVDFDTNGGGVKFLDEWKKLVNSGYAGNLGRSEDDTENAFIAGKTAMYIESTADLKHDLSSIGGRFELGTAALPTIDGTKDSGVSIGGASMWILKNKDAEKQKAAFEFIKYMVSSKQQAYWSSETGYFPVTKKAYEEQTMKDNIKKNPQFKTAINQLHASPKTSVGALMAVFPEARQTIEGNIEKMLQNKQSPEEAINNSAKLINQSIEDYNNKNK